MIDVNRIEERLAHAKINLYLDIVGRRTDGYHLLDTVMQTLALADRLSFTWLEAKDEETFAAMLNEQKREGRSLQHFKDFAAFELLLDIENDLANRLAEAESNILYKALQHWFKALEPRQVQKVQESIAAASLRQACLLIKLDKLIPPESGLGGASADAAALLDYLDECFTLQWDDAARLSLESKIGADVPFTRRKGTQRCLGIGEKMSALPGLPPFACVLIKPLRLGVKTAAAFKRYSEIFVMDAEKLQRPQCEAFVEALKAEHWGDLQRLGGNVFASLIDDEFSVLPQWLERLSADGSFLCSLSGSGTACFALFENPAQAAACAAELSRLTELNGVPFALYLTELAC